MTFAPRLRLSSHARLFALPAMAALVLMQTPPLRAQTYVNPLLGDIGVHDPMMIKQGGTYYIFHTGNGISIKTSKDKITWKNAGSAITTLPAWHKQYVPDNTGHLWAPDVVLRNGKYHLYYSVSSFGKNVSAIGLATSPTLDQASPTYAWKDEGMVLRSTAANNYNCIDPNIFVDSAGIPWMDFGSWWTGIKLVELDSVTGKPAANAPLISLANKSGGAVEAAFIVKWGTYHYQFISWDKCCAGVESTYKIAVGRSLELAGPYLDKTGKKMTDGGGVLIDDGDSRWIGPGHNAVFFEGDSTFLVNHAYDAQKDGQAILQIRPLYWTEGWPTLTKPATTAIGSPRRISSPREAVFMAGFSLFAPPEAAPVARFDFMGRGSRQGDAPGIFVHPLPETR